MQTAYPELRQGRMQQTLQSRQLLLTLARWMLVIGPRALEGSTYKAISKASSNRNTMKQPYFISKSASICRDDTRTCSAYIDQNIAYKQTGLETETNWNWSFSNPKKTNLFFHPPQKRSNKQGLQTKKWSNHNDSPPKRKNIWKSLSIRPFDAHSAPPPHPLGSCCYLLAIPTPERSFRRSARSDPWPPPPGFEAPWPLLGSVSLQRSFFCQVFGVGMGWIWFLFLSFCFGGISGFICPKTNETCFQSKSDQSWKQHKTTKQ